MKKKLTAAILATLITAGSLPVTAYAANGSSEYMWSDGWYPAYVAFYSNNEENYKLFGQNQTYTGVLEGAEYDRTTNTLTLTDFNHPELYLETNMMGDDFKLDIEGECVLGVINVWGYMYGGSLTVTGSGELTVNPDKSMKSAIRLMAQESDSKLYFDSDVTVHLYGMNNEGTDDNYSALVLYTTHSDMETGISFANPIDYPVEAERFSYESSDYKPALVQESDDWTSYHDFRLSCDSDPDGIYSAIEVTYDNGEKKYNVLKFLYLESFDAVVNDPDFNMQMMTEDELEKAGFHFVTDLLPSTIKYSSEWDENNRGVQATKVTCESDPNGIYCANFSWNGVDDHDPDNYYIHRLLWDENQQYYVEDESFESVSFSAEEFAASEYKLVYEDVVKNIQFKSWYYVDLPPSEGDGNFQHSDNRVLCADDPDTIYIQIGTYGTYEDRVEGELVDEGYFIKPVYYNEEYGEYYRDSDSEYSPEGIEVSYKDFEDGKYSFMTEVVNEQIELRYLPKDYDPEDYLSEGYRVEKDDVLYLATEYTTVRGGVSIKCYDIFDLTYDEGKGYYVSGEYICDAESEEELEEKGYHFIKDEQRVKYTTKGDVDYYNMEVYEDTAGNQYLCDFDGNVYTFSEDETLTLNGKKYYVPTLTKEVSRSDLTAPQHTVETDLYMYRLRGSEFTYEGNGEHPLVNKSSINSEKISLGSRITFNGDAKGGSGSYTYTYSYKRTSAKLWKTIGTEDTEATVVFFTPVALGDFDIKITAKDSKGNTAEKTFTVSVVDGKSTAFKNNSTINVTGAKPGTKIKLTGVAEGTGTYKYAFYYKRTTAKQWYIIGTEFSDTNMAQFTPKTEGEFNVKVDIIDENGEIVSRQFAVSISNDYAIETSMKNRSSIDTEIAPVDSRITITGAATRGTAPYKYAYYYKKAAAKNWKAIGEEFTDAKTASIKLRNEGDYIIKVCVKDSTGAMVSKNFDVTITAE